MGNLDVSGVNIFSGTKEVYSYQIQKTLKKAEYMKRADLEFSAMKTAEKACNSIDGMYEYANGFVVGAEWRINSVWHNASEIPKLKSKAILAIRRAGSSERVFFLERKRWENFIKHCDIINWAYIDDLTPKEE